MPSRWACTKLFLVWRAKLIDDHTELHFRGSRVLAGASQAFQKALCTSKWRTAQKQVVTAMWDVFGSFYKVVLEPDCYATELLTWKVGSDPGSWVTHVGTVGVTLAGKQEAWILFLFSVSCSTSEDSELSSLYNGLPSPITPVHHPREWRNSPDSP